MFSESKYVFQQPQIISLRLNHLGLVYFNIFSRSDLYIQRCFLVEYVTHSPPILRINGDGTEPLNYSHTRGHAPKYRMFSVQERSRGECDEELGTYKRH